MERVTFYRLVNQPQSHVVDQEWKFPYFEKKRIQEGLWDRLVVGVPLPAPKNRNSEVRRDNRCQATVTVGSTFHWNVYPEHHTLSQCLFRSFRPIKTVILNISNLNCRSWELHDTQWVHDLWNVGLSPTRVERRQIWRNYDFCACLYACMLIYINRLFETVM
jgi:hypothetical protein